MGASLYQSLSTNAFLNAYFAAMRQKEKEKKKKSSDAHTLLAGKACTGLCCQYQIIVKKVRPSQQKKSILVPHLLVLRASKKDKAGSRRNSSTPCIESQ